MQVVLFTKFLEGMSIEQMGETVKDLGYDGFDLAVRSRHAVNPDNIADALPTAMTHWNRLGLRCPMITLGTEANDPDAPETIHVFEAAGAAGIPLIKIGYFPFPPEADYWSLIDEARARLKGFIRLAARTGVKAVYHTHSGSVLGSNCAGLTHLLRDFDPEHLGAYVDMGHMAVEGEDVQMGLSMVRGHLCVIGAKDARFVRVNDADEPAPWGKHFVYLGQGAAAWKPALRLLHSWKFKGPFTVHTEYTLDREIMRAVGGVDSSSAALEMRERGRVADLQFLRDSWAEVVADATSAN